MQTNHRWVHGIFINVLFILLIHPVSVGLAWMVQKESVDEVRDLSSIFNPGYILLDKNDDSVIDFVNVKIVVPDDPTETHLVCAANILARLGYETSGMNLDLVESRTTMSSSSSIPIISIDLLPRGAIEYGDTRGGLYLAPGQGRIQYYGADVYPDQGSVSILGADDTGLMAATNYLAGRYPDLWKLKTKTCADVRRKFEEFLKQRDISWDESLLKAVDVDAKRPGILKLSLVIRLKAQIDWEKAVKALEGKEVLEKEAKRLKRKDLDFQDVHKIAVELISSKSRKTIILMPEKPWKTKLSAEELSLPSRDFSLSQLFTIQGLFQDKDKDFLPDNIPAYLSVGGIKDVHTIDNLAARLGLESTGITIPIARVAGEEENPERFGLPVLIGTDHYAIHRLMEKGKLCGIDQFPRSGYIQIVPEAFGDKNGIVMGAKDGAGLKAISDYVSQRLPYLWDYGKGHFKLDAIEQDVAEFFQIRKAPGQVALALDKLETWLQRIATLEIDSVGVEIAAEKIPQDLNRIVHEYIRKYFGSASTGIRLYPTGFGVDQPVIAEEFDLPWEVDAFWRYFLNDALPRITPNSEGEIRVLVSESPEIRDQLKRQIEEALKKKSIPEGAFEVIVLCAYKQGYSWLNDEVLPKLTDKSVGRIQITYRSLKDSKEVRWQTIQANTRWLQELYPIDCVMARELNISDSLITFHPTQKPGPIYKVEVFDKGGNPILKDSFSPKYVVQPFFTHFPEYDSVRVTTGWVYVNIAGRSVLDRRIKTDPETFWEHLQTDTYRKIIDYVMDIQDGRPASENVPFFDALNVKLTMSEPNYRIGIDEELISSLEALHEDILFETLTLFNLISGRYGFGSVRFPGRIIPDIQSPVHGQPGRVKITFTGKERARPQFAMTYREQGKECVRKEYDLSPWEVSDPKLTGIWVEPKKEGITQLMFEVTANDSVDRYQEFKLRSTENDIDRSFIPITRLANMVDILSHLRQRGIFEDALSYDRIENLRFRVVLEDSSEYAQIITLPRSRNPSSTKNPVLYDQKFKYTGQRLVEWDAPLNPTGVADKLAKLNTFPNIHVYYSTTSFLNHDIFTVDLFPPMETGLFSQAKLNATKPTLFLVGRVHGNEVSSTSHILRLAELCATDTTYMKHLKNVNLVLYPVANPDGAQMAYEMQQINPDFMLHAGRYGALGTDVRSRNGDRDNRYPEAGMVQKLREIWLPDVVLDLHGVPSHEWVQLFAGYSAWVRSRNVGPRSYWLPRGWYITGFSWLEDKEYPELMKAQRAILDTIITAVRAQPDVDAMNQRLYKRYIKYGRQDMENYREYFHNGIQVEARLKPRKVTGSDVTGPKITYFSATTEAADETARGDWMELVCKAGLAHTSAALGYLSGGVNRIERDAKEYQHGVSRRIFRKRPVLPAGKEAQGEKKEKAGY